MGDVSLCCETPGSWHPYAPAYRYRQTPGTDRQFGLGPDVVRIADTAGLAGKWALPYAVPVPVLFLAFSFLLTSVSNFAAKGQLESCTANLKPWGEISPGGCETFGLGLAVVRHLPISVYFGPS